MTFQNFFRAFFASSAHRFYERSYRWWKPLRTCNAYLEIFFSGNTTSTSS